MRKLLDVIHGNGAKAIAHINHPGRMANPKIPGNYHWSSTGKACENGGAIPKKMDREMMDKVVLLRVVAAQRAEKAGFDMVELQMGHGYLMAQFLSPAVNDREDEYSGSFENRMRFPLEVLKAVKSVLSIPLIVRLSGDEIIPSGFHVEDMVVFAKRIEQEGIAAIHVTAGSACSTPPWFFQHMFVPKGKTWQLAGKIKENVHIPVIFVGRINSTKDIDLLKEKYHTEYFALGRALVADPDFVGKLDGKWVENYCKGDWLSCVRYQKEETGIYHPDNMLPDGNVDEHCEARSNLIILVICALRLLHFVRNDEKLLFGVDSQLEFPKHVNGASATVPNT